MLKSIADKYRNASPEAQQGIVNAGILALLLTGGLAVAAAFKHDAEQTEKANPSQAVAAAIQAHRPVHSLLHQGRATITLKNGRKVNIIDPLLTENGTVLERTPDSNKSLVTAYKPAGSNVLDIYYAQDGEQLTAKQAFDRSTSVIVEAPAHADYFLPAAGQQDAGEHIAQSNSQ